MPSFTSRLRPAAPTSAPSAPVQSTAAAPSLPRERIAGLDAARAIAVLAMVFGHTMDAVLSEEARLVPWVKQYWHVRNFTAPLFLFVSGYVLLTVLSRMDAGRPPSLRRFLPRVGLLFALGYLLRFPLWDVRGLFRGDAELWRYASTFDALQCIAAGILLTLGVCTVFRGFWSRGAALLTLVVTLVAGAAPVWALLGGNAIPTPLAQTFGGGDSRFALFPWGGYFLSGGALAWLLSRVGNVRTRATILAALGLTLLLLLPGSRPRLPDTDISKFLWRLGPVTMLVAVALWLPSAWTKWLAPVGRASLWAYVIHLPIAYGWAFWPGLSTRVGRTLSAGSACALAVAVVGISVSTALLARRLIALRKWEPLWKALRTSVPLRARSEEPGSPG